MSNEFLVGSSNPFIIRITPPPSGSPSSNPADDKGNVMATGAQKTNECVRSASLIQPPAEGSQFPSPSTHQIVAPKPRYAVPGKSFRDLFGQ